MLEWERKEGGTRFQRQTGINSSGKGKNPNVAPKFHAFGNDDTKDRERQVKRTRTDGDDEFNLEILSGMSAQGIQ